MRKSFHSEPALMPYLKTSYVSAPLVNTADRTHDKLVVVTKLWQWFDIYERDTFAMLRGDPQGRKGEEVRGANYGES